MAPAPEAADSVAIVTLPNAARPKLRWACRLIAALALRFASSRIAARSDDSSGAGPRRIYLDTGSAAALLDHYKRQVERWRDDV